MIRYGPLLPSHDRIGWFENRDMAFNNRILFFCHGTWMYNLWRELDTVGFAKMELAELPVFQPVNHTLGGYIPSFAVMKNSPNRDKAIEILMWWANPSVAEKWVRYTKTPTGIRGNLNDATLGHDKYEKFQAYIDNTYGHRVHYSANAGYLLGMSNAHLWDELNTELRLLLSGSTTAAQSYRKIMAQCRQDKGFS